MIVACVALFAALSGTVYAAARIDLRAIKRGSLPGNRVKPKSLPGNRVKPSSLPGNRLKTGTLAGAKLIPRSVDGSRVDAATLDQVPSAAHAEVADSAGDAETALNAVSAITAETINGYGAGCRTGTRPFAGACWQTASSEAAVTAPAAAESCAAQGGELPDALTLAAFSRQAGIALDDGDEWTGDLTNFTGTNLFAVVTVSSLAAIKTALSTEPRKYRCVIPLVG
ncbi:MAG TPA: hypothetical protein VF121_09390 [Thermoanaerobaculia bacterium]|nr:hypothetical protein [Thermoanaerobaculia bacterium]